MDGIALLTIFVLSIFVGFEVVSKVSTVLHTPLMSGANAIHGIVLLGGIIGSTAAVGLFFLGVPYFYVLALIAGVGELIPIVGPILAAIPAVAVAFTGQKPRITFIPRGTVDHGEETAGADRTYFFELK